MNTIVYQIESNGKTSELATYDLNPYDAIKAVYLHKVKKYMNSSNYGNIKLDIKESNSGYYFTYNSAQLFTLKENTIEQEKQNEYKIS